MKTLILSVFLVVAFNSSAVITITKHNKGLFGYRTIDEHHWQGHGEMNHSLNCTDPGWKGCKWDNPPTNGSGDPIVNTLESIEERVNQSIINGALVGDFQFDNYFVEYIYEEESGRLEIRIYTEEEYRNKESN
jgi:hypothetical protein